MENVDLILYIAIAIPLAAVLLFCERKARTTLLFLLIGMTVCLFCGEVNTLLFRVIPLPLNLFIVNITPTTEEICKALPVVVYAFLYRPGRRPLLSAAFALGIGFAILENTSVLFSSENIDVALAVLRGLGCGLSHGLCTMAVGYGCSYVYKRRKLFYTGTFALLSLSITFHAVCNLFVIADHSLLGSLLPVLLLVILLPIALLRKRSTQKKNI